VDQSTLVEDQIDDGRRFVERFAADGNPVQAAFWVKTAEEGGKTLGSTAVEQTYIYAPHFFTFTQANPMTTEDVGRAILRLMNRGPGIMEPSHVTLKDGTVFNGVPFSLDLGTQRAMVVQFVADGEAAPRVVRLDEIASIS